MNNQHDKIKTLKDDELNKYILIELYSQINTHREMMKISKLYRDEAAENALSAFFLEEIKTDDNLETKMKDVNYY